MLPRFDHTPASLTEYGRPARLARDFAGLLASATEAPARTALLAAWIHDSYLRFVAQSRHLPWRALAVFEAREHRAAVLLGKLRLSLYSEAIRTLAADLRRHCPELATDRGHWSEVEAAYHAAIRGRYDADLAFAFLNSVSRRVNEGVWRPVEYAFDDAHLRIRPAPGEVMQEYPWTFPLSAAVCAEILQAPRFSIRWRALGEDAALLAERLNQRLKPGEAEAVTAIQMLRGAFFRNRGCYLVGRLARRDGAYRPLIIALLNSSQGIHAEALLTEVSHVHNLFSSTLATFHVTNFHYHEVAAFLHSVMPQRPLGLHYSTIGFHHLSKVAMMREIEQELELTGEQLDLAPGSRGTVAIGFCAPHGDYVLKVVRDRPTAGYKWGHFAGVDSVLEKYRRVHDINRTSSMLDNAMYWNLKLDRRWFAPGLLAELAQAAGDAVQVQEDVVAFRYLIVQRRLTPLNLFLEQATPELAQRVITNLGYCIRNNAAANLFNKDFDARNYGVSRYLKVYLYDYDALEALTEVKVRTNRDRDPGEEDIPDWFFEDGVVFLPEELDVGLNLRQPEWLRIFRRQHGDLLTVAWWEDMQQRLRSGQVPLIRTYPEECDLRPAATATAAATAAAAPAG